MFKNYLKIAFRNLLKHKSYATINILGLAIGLACCFLILLFIFNELSYDRYHTKADQIYRVVENEPRKGCGTATPFLLAPTLKSAFPEIQETVRIISQSMEVKCGKSFITESHIICADASFFKIFTLPLIKGSPEAVLAQPNSLVITRAMAEKYFGEAEPIGNILTLRNDKDLYQLTVTGVIEAFPENSHFRADFITSMSLVQQIFTKADLFLQARFGFKMPPLLENWGACCFGTYLLLPPDYAAPELEKKLPEFCERHIKNSRQFSFYLQPLTDIHLYTTLAQGHSDFTVQGNINMIYILSTISLLILIAASLNFIIISTARYTTRTKEIGLRKVIGAQRSDLTQQILGESIMVTLLALPIALLLVELFLPVLNSLLGQNITVQFYYNWKFLLGLILLTIVVGTVSGSYLAFYISGFQPAEIFMNQAHKKTAKAYFRKVLVVVQLTIFIGMLVCSLIIYRQLRFIQNKDLGFNQANMLIVNMTHFDFRNRYPSFKNEVEKYSGVTSVSAASDVPPLESGMLTKVRTSEKPDEEVEIQILQVDYDFFKTLQARLIQGREFSRDFPADHENALVLNEAAVARLGIKQPLGAQLYFGPDDTGPQIIGVVNDFHLNSLYQKINPVIFSINSDLIAKVLIRIKPENIDQTLTFLEKQWQLFNPEGPFDYQFMDGKIEQLYGGEYKFKRIIDYFTFITILVASLGLFGLALFIAEQRTKEIGVRKVLGASVTGIVTMLSREFVKLTLIACVLAYPVAFYVMQNWLDDFAYRIKMDFITFILSGLLAIGITLLTVSLQAIRAARANPVEVLRYE